MKLGIICPSEIALRRFMPSLEKVPYFTFAGIGVCTAEERFGSSTLDENSMKTILNVEYDKARVFIDQYGGKLYEGYETIVTSSEIDAVYIPLPPALHYKWAKIALEHGKHVLVEKPSTTSFEDSNELVRIAEANGLALHENYMFLFHNQLDAIKKIIDSGEIGDIRLYRISFGFPLRQANDFRYNRELGGGAIIDAGGYTIRYAASLLGDTAVIRYAQSNYTEQYNVDMYGSAALTNSDGVTVQVAFGMDNNYKCELEVWGSKGCLSTGRILTAPAGFKPVATIRKGNEDKIVELPEDDAFMKSIQNFKECIDNKDVRNKQYSFIVKQAELVDEFKRQAGWK